MKIKTQSFVTLTFVLTFLSMPLMAGTVSGVVSSDKGRLIKNARVTVWDKDPASRDDQLGQAMTSKNGRYVIQYRARDSRGATDANDKPDIYVTVDIRVRGRWERVATSKIYKNNTRSALKINIRDINRTALFARRTIYGVVKNSKGKPVAGLVVKAWDKDWGNKRELMGQATTDEKGVYRIAYSPRQWDGFASKPDIFITVSKQKSKRVIGRSQVAKNHDTNKRLMLNARVR